MSDYGDGERQKRDAENRLEGLKFDQRVRGRRGFGFGWGSCLDSCSSTIVAAGIMIAGVIWLLR